MYDCVSVTFRVLCVFQHCHVGRCTTHLEISKLLLRNGKECFNFVFKDTFLLASNFLVKYKSGEVIKSVVLFQCGGCLF